MKEFSREWHSGGFRRKLLVRCWHSGSIWQSLWRCLTLRAYPCDRPRFYLRRYPNLNYYCYCHEGTSVFVRAKLLGCGVLIWYSQDRIKRPCPCDQAVAELFPEPADA